jgi:uncharacterized delta-60 repeat protein
MEGARMTRTRHHRTVTWPALAVATVMTVVLSAGPARADAGSLDPAFDHDGKATTRFFAGPSSGSSVAVQADGRVVVAGSAGGRFALARYTTTGTLDPTFGGDGRVTTELAFGSAIAMGVSIQTNGRIVVAGCADSGGPPPSRSAFVLARYLSDGTLDASFGGGLVTTRFGSNSCANGLTIQPNGKIVAVGGYRTSEGVEGGFAVARYLPSGRLDPAFSGDGKATIGSFATFSAANGVAIQPNAKIVVVGGYDYYGFALARFNQDGTPDAGFGTGGRVTTTPAGCGEGAAEAVVVQSDGRIVVAGYSDVGHEAGDHCGPAKFALVRYLPDGSLDPSFSGDGQAATGFPGGGIAHAAAIDSQGRIVAVGWFRSGFALARYRRDGMLDGSFGTGGRVLTVFQLGHSFANGVAVGPAGKIVAAGWVSLSHGARFAVARYLAA